MCRHVYIHVYRHATGIDSATVTALDGDSPPHGATSRQDCAHTTFTSGQDRGASVVGHAERSLVDAAADAAGSVGRVHPWSTSGRDLATSDQDVDERPALPFVLRISPVSEARVLKVLWPI